MKVMIKLDDDEEEFRTTTRSGMQVKLKNDYPHRNQRKFSSLVQDVATPDEQDEDDKSDMGDDNDE